MKKKTGNIYYEGNVFHISWSYFYVLGRHESGEVFRANVFHYKLMNNMSNINGILDCCIKGLLYYIGDARSQALLVNAIKMKRRPVAILYSVHYMALLSINGNTTIPLPIKLSSGALHNKWEYWSALTSTVISKVTIN